jgi:hypothetical protein
MTYLLRNSNFDERWDDHFDLEVSSIAVLQESLVLMKVQLDQ